MLDNSPNKVKWTWMEAIDMDNKVAKTEAPP